MTNHSNDTLTKMSSIVRISDSVTDSDVTPTEMARQRYISHSVTERKASRDDIVRRLCEYGRERYARRHQLFLCSHHLNSCRQCWEARQVFFASIRDSSYSDIKEVVCKCGRHVFFRGDRKTYLQCFDCDQARRKALQAAWRDANIPKAAEVLCQKCGTMFQPKRSTAKFCSTRCRVAFNRASGKGGEQ